ncbi:Uncharacterized protein QJS10_CPB17g02382 [Acorus calamus]|uniref:MORF/ORRM1/DAG-like MORF domain-containing protein n=1 Tax=Acorus calamus TaxID=4465 RepID=A0AAV9CSN9_ACOCL|nr:Uncharacterized protein QJS10_CPB17g02382 [Acorus calamus]
MEPPEENATRDEIIDSYIKTLAQVVGSEQDARMKIYSVSTKHYFAFGALVSEELSYKIKELPRVRWVLPDSYLDVKNKDYGGEPFIDGVAAPYDPKYHEEWVRNNARANERSRRNDRPRNLTGQGTSRGGGRTCRTRTNTTEMVLLQCRTSLSRTAPTWAVHHLHHLVRVSRTNPTWVAPLPLIVVTKALLPLTRVTRAPLHLTRVTRAIRTTLTREACHLREGIMGACRLTETTRTATMGRRPIEMREGWRVVMLISRGTHRAETFLHCRTGIISG